MSKAHSTTAAPGNLEQLWLSEAIRLREACGERLEDREANRLARAAGGDLSRRIQTRALWLASRDGQLAALEHYQQGARLALAILLLLALCSGAALAFGALGDGQRPVNLLWALASLLGLNLLMLAGWLLSWLLPGHTSGTLGQLWQWLSTKLARDAQTAQLLPALMLLLQRQRLSRWGFGLLSHGLWLLTLSSALVMLMLLLASRRYGFVWETTLLPNESFVSLTQALGAVPALLGFSLPDSQMIRASGSAALLDDSSRQAWASWLLGVLLVFGLLPRLLLTLLCLGCWQHGKRRLSLDLSLPDYQMLRTQLQPSSERLGISDSAPQLTPSTAANANQQASSGALLVAIELDPQRPWPPALPKTVADAGVLDSREQRQHLLEQLSRFPPARLAIACDPRRSPDRGTLALLGELARSAAATRIWLLPAAPGEALDSERLSDWHQALAQLQLPHADSAPFNWLETGHD
ncbi:MAG: DUF2868 domain-containing protein [Pseudomonadaceae bacterium]|nr:DUF2868 domain-containing protein [Pseudomonadaceae bacterium]